MEQLINAKIKELTENGKLDEIVTNSAVKFIQEMVKYVLSPYGEVSKQYKATLQEKVLSGIATLDFIQYSKTLTDLVESELNKSIVEHAINPAKEMLNTFVGALEKKHWKLSEIIEEYKEKEVRYLNDNQSGEIQFIYEVSDYGTVHVAFDKEEDKKGRRYSCKYRLMIDAKTNKLYAPTVDGLGVNPITEMGGLYGFDLFLFKLYAMGCTIELDHHNVDPEWSTYND